MRETFFEKPDRTLIAIQEGLYKEPINNLYKYEKCKIQCPIVCHTSNGNTLIYLSRDTEKNFPVLGPIAKPETPSSAAKRVRQISQLAFCFTWPHACISNRLGHPWISMYTPGLAWTSREIMEIHGSKVGG